MEVCRVTIPLKLPSLNEYINACRRNRYAGAQMKKDIERDIAVFLRRLPVFTEPIFVTFHWVEENRRRDLDGVAFGKKFILDALVKVGKIRDDSARYVTGFCDFFDYGKKAMVTVEISRG